MQSASKRLVGHALAVAAALALSALAASAQQQPAETGADTPGEATTPYVMPKSGPFRPDQIEIANKAAIEAWARSPHADASAEAFTHWDAEGAVPPDCATCHSGAGFRSFYGLDGSKPGEVDTPVPTGGVVDCDTCHNPGLAKVTEVSLPNGKMHPVVPGEASCITCHQGRASGATVAKAVAGKPADRPDPKLRFINPHYALGASVWLGGYAGSGYQYPGKEYSGRFFHARPVATCVSCHDPHTLKVSETTCLSCHETGVPADIRLSRVSYDGSGDLKKGIKSDIEANADRLLSLVLDYAAKVAGTPMVHDPNRYPYFFADANGDGRADEAEGRPVAYAAWTPRLLKAVYNWKFVTADGGAFAHNPHYVLELLYDSIADLSGPLGVDVGSLGIRR